MSLLGEFQQILEHTIEVMIVILGIMSLLIALLYYKYSRNQKKKEEL